LNIALKSYVGASTDTNIIKGKAEDVYIREVFASEVEVRPAVEWEAKIRDSVVKVLNRPRLGAIIYGRHPTRVCLAVGVARRNHLIKEEHNCSATPNRRPTAEFGQGSADLLPRPHLK